MAKLETTVYGDFDEIILRPDDADKLQKAVDLLNTFNKNKETVAPLFLD